MEYKSVRVWMFILYEISNGTFEIPLKYHTH